MLPEHEIKLEQERVNKQLKTMITDKLKDLGWNNAEYSKVTGKCPSTICEVINNEKTHDTNTLIFYCYYLGIRINVLGESHNFIGFTPERKNLN